MVLQSIKYNSETYELEILDQLLLPEHIKYLKIKGVEDGWSVINKMQVCLHVNLQICLRRRTLLHIIFVIISIFCRFEARQRSP